MALEGLCAKALSALDTEQLEHPPHDGLITLAKPIASQDQGNTNRCGTYSLSMALSYWQPEIYGPNKKDGKIVGNEIKKRIMPVWMGGGATRPALLKKYLKKAGFNHEPHKDATLEILQQYLCAGIPCIVGVSVDAKFFRPHYKVAVGYDVTSVYFNNSSGDFRTDLPTGDDYSPFGHFEQHWDAGIYKIWKRLLIPVFPRK